MKIINHNHTSQSKYCFEVEFQWCPRKFFNPALKRSKKSNQTHMESQSNGEPVTQNLEQPLNPILVFEDLPVLLPQHGNMAWGATFGRKKKNIRRHLPIRRIFWGPAAWRLTYKSFPQKWKTKRSTRPSKLLKHHVSVSCFVCKWTAPGD